MFDIAPGPAVGVAVNGSTLKNYGPGTVYYGTRQSTTSSSNDGNIASGSSAALAGTQFLYVTTRCTVAVLPTTSQARVGTATIFITSTDPASSAAEGDVWIDTT